MLYTALHSTKENQVTLQLYYWLTLSEGNPEQKQL